MFRFCFYLSYALSFCHDLGVSYSSWLDVIHRIYLTGIKRERAAVVFTPMMAFVMGGKNYKKHDLFEFFSLLGYRVSHICVPFVTHCS